MKRKGCGPQRLGSPIKQAKPLTRQQREQQIERENAKRQQRRLEQQERRQERAQNKARNAEALRRPQRAVDTTDN